MAAGYLYCIQQVVSLLKLCLSLSGKKEKLRFVPLLVVTVGISVISLNALR